MFTIQRLTLKIRTVKNSMLFRCIKEYNGRLLKFSLEVGFERVFIFSVTLDTRKNERQMSVSTIET
jgi:hypothetical protein